MDHTIFRRKITNHSEGKNPTTLNIKIIFHHESNEINVVNHASHKVKIPISLSSLTLK